MTVGVAPTNRFSSNAQTQQAAVVNGLAVLSQLSPAYREAAIMGNTKGTYILVYTLLLQNGTSIGITSMAAY